MSGTVLGAPGGSNGKKKSTGSDQKTTSSSEPLLFPIPSKGNVGTHFTPANTPTTHSMFHLGAEPKNDDNDEDSQPKKGKKKSSAQQEPINESAFIMNALKEKLEDMEVPELPLVLKRRVKALRNLNDQHSTLERQFFDEVRALEAKYFALYSPLYEKRREIVIGTHEPTDEEVGKLDEPKPDDKKSEDKKPEDKKPESKKEENEEDIKGIPDFWLNTLRVCSAVGETITDSDEDALRYLQDIQCEIFTDGEDKSKHGFKLHFHFNDNPYFTNKSLSKVYHLTYESNSEVLESADGTEVQWKAGKNLTVKTVKKKQRHKGGRGTRTVTKQEPCESFFNFFKPPPVPDKDTDMEKNDLMALQFDLETDYELGSAIKDKVIPHAILYFTGEAQEDEDYEDYEDGDMEDDDDEMGDDDEDEEEEEDEPPAKSKKGKGGDGKRGGDSSGRGAGGATLAGDKPPECKQQ